MSSYHAGRREFGMATPRVRSAITLYRPQWRDAIRRRPPVIYSSLIAGPAHGMFLVPAATEFPLHAGTAQADTRPARPWCRNVVEFRHESWLTKRSMPAFG